MNDEVRRDQLLNQFQPAFVRHGLDEQPHLLFVALGHGLHPPR
jgi:hypothetical protein